MKKFPIWKTISLGTFKNTDELLDELEKFRLREERNLVHTVRMNYRLIHHKDFAIAHEHTEIDLVKVTPVDLGFIDTYKYGKPRPVVFLSEMINRAREFGLVECPAEVGPQLRLQYKDQRDNEWLEIVMKPLLVPNGACPMHMVFTVLSYCTNMLGDPTYQRILDRWSAGPKGDIADQRTFGSVLVFALPR
jgi:hypothetical protein